MSGCPDELLSGWVDGELDADEARRVAAHVAGCARCREELEALEAVSEALGGVVPDPSPARWAGFERALDEELRRELAVRRPWSWTRRGLLAAAVLLLALGPALTMLRQRELPVRAAPARLPSVELPVPDLPQAGRDSAERHPAPLAADALRDARLGPEALARLRRYGLVQLPTRATRLDQWLGSDARPLPPLATADASLLITHAVLQRAALTVEQELIQPGLLSLLRLLAAEAARALPGATDPALATDLERLRERALVGLALEGERAYSQTELPPGALARVLAEVDLVRGDQPGRSTLDGEPLDPRALTPTGAWADPELADHARTAAWLSRWSPQLDSTHAAQLREAALATLLLARARLPDGRSGLHLQAELEAALELTSGPADGLTPLDVAAVLNGLAGWTPEPSRLADPLLLGRLAEGLRARARARGVPRVRGLDQGEAAPRFLLLGQTASFEGQLLDRLIGLPGRAHPSALDLPALLGSRRARTALAAARQDPPGLQAVLSALRPTVEAALQPGPLLPARASLEQARTFSAQALLGRLEPAPPALAEAAASPDAAAGAWDDRALLAGLAGLVAPRAAPDRFPGTSPGPIPLVEPLPHLHARLAFAARRVNVALRELLPESARRARALAQLERVALVEEALRDAALDQLEGRAPRPGTLRGLRLWAGALRELGPPDVRVAERLCEVSGPEHGLQVVHRAVVRLDRLVAATLDPARGQLVLAEGPALLACELVTDGERLSDPRRISAHPQARVPAWAVHVVPE